MSRYLVLTSLLGALLVPSMSQQVNVTTVPFYNTSNISDDTSTATSFSPSTVMGPTSAGQTLHSDIAQTSHGSLSSNLYTDLTSSESVSSIPEAQSSNVYSNSLSSSVSSTFSQLNPPNQSSQTTPSSQSQSSQTLITTGTIQDSQSDALIQSVQLATPVLSIQSLTPFSTLSSVYTSNISQLSTPSGISSAAFLSSSMTSFSTSVIQTETSSSQNGVMSDATPDLTALPDHTNARQPQSTSSMEASYQPTLASLSMESSTSDILSPTSLFSTAMIDDATSEPSVQSSILSSPPTLSQDQTITSLFLDTASFLESSRRPDVLFSSTLNVSLVSVDSSFGMSINSQAIVPTSSVLSSDVQSTLSSDVQSGFLSDIQSALSSDTEPAWSSVVLSSGFMQTNASSASIEATATSFILQNQTETLSLGLTLSSSETYISSRFESSTAFVQILNSSGIMTIQPTFGSDYSDLSTSLDSFSTSFIENITTISTPIPSLFVNLSETAVVSEATNSQANLTGQLKTTSIFLTDLSQASTRVTFSDLSDISDNFSGDIVSTAASSPSSFLYSQTPVSQYNFSISLQSMGDFNETYSGTASTFTLFSSAAINYSIAMSYSSLQTSASDIFSLSSQFSSYPSSTISVTESSAQFSSKVVLSSSVRPTYFDDSTTQTTQTTTSSVPPLAKVQGVLFYFKGSCESIVDIENGADAISGWVLDFLHRISNGTTLHNVQTKTIRCSPNYIKVDVNDRIQRSLVRNLADVFSRLDKEEDSTFCIQEYCIILVDYEWLDDPRRKESDEDSLITTVVVTIACCICLIILVAGGVFIGRDLYRKKKSTGFVTFPTEGFQTIEKVPLSSFQSAIPMYSTVEMVENSMEGEIEEAYAEEAMLRGMENPAYSDATDVPSENPDYSDITDVTNQGDLVADETFDDSIKNEYETLVEKEDRRMSATAGATVFTAACQNIERQHPGHGALDALETAKSYGLVVGVLGRNKPSDDVSDLYAVPQKVKQRLPGSSKTRPAPPVPEGNRRYFRQISLPSAWSFGRQNQSELLISPYEGRADSSLSGQFPGRRRLTSPAVFDPAIESVLMSRAKMLPPDRRFSSTGYENPIFYNKESSGSMLI